MRVGPRVAAVAVVLNAACTGGEGGSFTPSTASSPAPTRSPSTAPSTSITTLPVTDPAGSVTLRVTGLLLPDTRAGGSGLRLLVRAASPRLTVRRLGGGAPVTACPAAAPTTSVRAAECVGLGPGGAVEIDFVGGVELRATGAEAAVDEVGVTYLPAARATTLVTPARPSGGCATAPCEAEFSLLPGRAGAFVLDGHGAGGRPRLVLTASPAPGAPGSNRTLATVEGGGSLSIRATLEAGTEARLFHHEQGLGPIAPLTAEILWP